jgi:hypothetical protein
MTGEQGTTGAQGISGLQGTSGNMGQTGAMGISGNAGMTGAQGISGNQGLTGVPYGLAGTTGQTLYYDGGEWKATSSLYNNGTNVGIGTETPGERLEISKMDNGKLLITRGSSGSGYVDLVKLGDVDATNDGELLLYNSSGVRKVNIDAGDDTYFNNDGNVGIGLETPEAKFHVKTTSGNFRINDYAHLLQQNTDNSTTNYWSSSPRSTGNYDIAYGALSSGLVSSTDAKLTIKTDGNVGIGTITPASLFEVDLGDGSNPSVPGVRTVQITTPGAHTGLVYNDHSAGNYSRFNMYNVSNPILGNRYFGIEFDGDNALSIRKGGNVGIGTTVPSEKLEVNGNIDMKDQSYIKWSGSTNTSIYGDYGGSLQLYGDDDIVLDADDDIFFRDNGVTNMTIIETGNVGIGTTTPASDLDVNGYMILQYGTNINEFSTDGAFAGNSNYAVPTEKAVKTYVDGQIATAPDNLGNHTATTNLDLSDLSLNNVRNIFGKDYDDDTGGEYTGNTTRLLFRDNASMFYNGGVVVGSYVDNTWAAGLSDGYLIVEGNVGIGTISPSEKLEVNGNIQLTGSGTNGTTDNKAILFGPSASDNAFIRFETTGSDDAQLEIGTGDNGNERILFTQNGTERLIINENGNVGIGDINPTAKLHIDGNIKAILNNLSEDYGMNWNHVTGEIGYDLAEVMWVGEDVSEGDVVSVSSSGRKLIKSNSSYEKSLIGIVSNTSNPRAYPILQLGDIDQMEGLHPGRKYKYICLAGQVEVKVNLENGEIKPGDWITSSSIPGEGMKAINSGNVIGKALEGIYNDKGQVKKTILVLVSLNEISEPDLLEKLQDKEDNINNLKSEILNIKKYLGIDENNNTIKAEIKSSHGQLENRIEELENIILQQAVKKD